MAEWSNAAVLKTVVRLPADRGFESLFLRNKKQSRHVGAVLFLPVAVRYRFIIHSTPAGGG